MKRRMFLSLSALSALPCLQLPVFSPAPPALTWTIEIPTGTVVYLGQMTINAVYGKLS